MPVYKRKYRSGKVVWYYQFATLGSTRENQSLVTESGFATKQEATAAEASRRAEEMVRQAATAGVAAPMPTTLAMLLAEFMRHHAKENLAPKTVERYREMVAYIAPELLAVNMTDITPLHLSREWSRLLKCGGHTRNHKAPRAMKPKTVRNIAGLVSSAFARAIKWGLAATNPVTHSDLPRVRRRIGMALLPAEQDRLAKCATGPWCLPTFLDISAATGARRGEILALRWSDVKGMIVLIDRSLCQTRAGLVFKCTKTEEPRKVELPPSALACLDSHRLRQNEFRRQFGPDYQSELDLIFANPDGSPLMPNSISSTVSRLCRRLGLPKGASLHVLRHSHASLLLADGVDLATVSARLGHSSVRTTAEHLQPRDPRKGPRRGAVLGQHHAASARRKAQGRKLKRIMAKKMGSKPDPEMQLARYLASAFIAYSHGIGIDYALKKYAHMPVGPFWIELARMVSAGAPQAKGQVRPTISAARARGSAMCPEANSNRSSFSSATSQFKQQSDILGASRRSGTP